MAFEYVLNLLNKERKDQLDYLNYLKNNKQVHHGVFVDQVVEKINELDLAIELLKGGSNG